MPNLRTEHAPTAQAKALGMNTFYSLLYLHLPSIDNENKAKEAQKKMATLKTKAWKEKKQKKQAQYAAQTARKDKDEENNGKSIGLHLLYSCKAPAQLHKGPPPKDNTVSFCYIFSSFLTEFS